MIIEWEQCDSNYIMKVRGASYTSQAAVRASLYAHHIHIFAGERSHDPFINLLLYNTRTHAHIYIKTYI